MKPFLWVCAGVLLLLPGNSFAQQDRYELGQRLKALELLWDEKKPEGDARKRVSGPLTRSVTSFFTMQLGEAGRYLDDARFSLLSEQPPSNARRWAAALSVRPQTRLIDTNAKELAIELYAFYPPKVEPVSGARLRLLLVSETGKPVGRGVEAPVAQLPMTVPMPLEAIGEGDFWLTAEIIAEKESLASIRQRISVLSEPAERLRKMGAVVEKTEQRTVTAETLRAHRALLESLLNKKTLETDYPAARLFAEAETLVASLDQGNDDLLKNRPGQYWLTLPTGAGRTAVRLYAPQNLAKTDAVPLVIAMHGAGGSENMFFEGYGAGGIVKLCEKRGWLLVAPRAASGFGRAASTADFIDALAKLYPVDRKRVFLVGHSMGASTAVAMVSAGPDKVAAVAVLGGGGRIAQPETVKAVPFFIGCGKQDFAIALARSLAKSLEKVNGLTVIFKEYVDIEHLAIVQVALPDVFAFFDTVARKSEK